MSDRFRQFSKGFVSEFYKKKAKKKKVSSEERGRIFAKNVKSGAVRFGNFIGDIADNTAANMKKERSYESYRQGMVDKEFEKRAQRKRDGDYDFNFNF